MHIDFTDAFRATHHVGGINSLVCRNHHELLDTIFHAEVGNDFCAVDIIEHSLRGVVLHHWYMFIGCSMEYKIGMIFAKDGFHTCYTVDASHDDIGLNIRKILCHHEADVVLGRLCLVNQNHSLWFVDSNLPNHFGTDATSGTCNQDTLVLQQLTYRLHVNINLSAREQVFYRDLIQLHTLYVFIGQLSVFDFGFCSLAGHENLTSCSYQ